MNIKEAMKRSNKELGTIGIFYHPITMDAVLSNHREEPPGYILLCDCSKAVVYMDRYGLEGAYDLLTE